MPFDDQTIQAVWEEGAKIPGYDPNLWRKDQCGAWIKHDLYGDRSSMYGWEIDHITPVSRGGTNALSNLRSLQWENNASRQDDRLVCKVKANGSQNIHI